MKIKLGIIFGGPSKEREISFAGGRTVYDNLDKSIFEPIPIFVDSHRQPILLDWEYVYKGSIRDFFPAAKFHPEVGREFQIYQESISDPEIQDEIRNSVGKSIKWFELAEYVDFAFLCLHGEFGEDGKIQGLFESLEIPYSGSGIRASSIGIDKAFQKNLLEDMGWPSPKIELINRSEIHQIDWKARFLSAKATIGMPIVIRPAKQGSSLGVSILREPCGHDDFKEACLSALFIQEVDLNEYQAKSKEDRIQFVRQVSDVREGIGLPMEIAGEIIHHPKELLDRLENAKGASVRLENLNNEENILIEEFIHGIEFSGIVIKDENGIPICLPPTEIIKSDEVFDYRAKYLPGLARKRTPIEIDNKDIERIQKACEDLFIALDFQAYARIDGFIRPDGEIFLNDPNTTSGMLPSSFFFHQAAEIGLNPSQMISYVIWISLKDRITENRSILKYQGLLEVLENKLAEAKSRVSDKQKIGVIMGGYSFERHISVESGRNVFEKLASSEKYDAIPIFLKKEESGHSLHLLPINLLLKDNADDIRDSLHKSDIPAVTQKVRAKTRSLRSMFQQHTEISFPTEISYAELAEMVDAVFIALHGRPGEDGDVQKKLQQYGIPYNGSESKASEISINKFDTIKLLQGAGFVTTDQQLIYKKEFQESEEDILSSIEDRFTYPFIVKPVDDGCSSAVVKIGNRSMLTNYLQLIYEDDEAKRLELREAFGLSPREEFPLKDEVLVEALIAAKDAHQFMEVTVGLYTEIIDDKIVYTVMEPSEALSDGDVLSLEEKFLAGEGLNITPARFGNSEAEYRAIAEKVKADIQRAAELVGIEGYARIDAFVRILENGNVETIIIEINNLPGMTPATCIFHQAALKGLKPYDFIDKILNYAFDKERIASRQIPKGSV